MPQGFYFESKIISETKSSIYPDLPYFLNDLRPAGFLGRLIPRQNTDLNLPSDISFWSADNCLVFLTSRTWNTIGNYIVGEASFQLYLQNYQSIKQGINNAAREKSYLQYADDILSIGDIGSSAGGEQPKFMTMLLPNKKQVIVKFSPPIDTEIGLRVADLMICEHLALQVLKKYSQESANSKILLFENKVFLEVERFDRGDTLARRGLISLCSLDAEFTGITGTWSQTSKALIEEKIIPKSFYKNIRWREIFGNLIANADMHLYNLSFFTRGLNVIALAPVYDMPKNKEAKSK
jgi:hypothetical protein